MKIHNAISNKKILIYGLGKSGISSFNFLKKKNSCCIFDDNRKVIKKNYNKYYISKLKLLKIKFDYIIISPGININNCTLSTYLKKNSKLIITELDIFYKFFPKIFTITITGTNGKSTTCKLLYEILLKHGIDARLTGNIGNPLLKEKKISRKTIFIVEASSYQLAYSKFFKSNISLILNISIDHLERHLTLRSYILAKLKAVTKQKKNDLSIIKNDILIKNLLKQKNIKSKIIYLKINKYLKLKRKIKNKYLIKSINLQNITFLFELSSYLNLNLKIMLKTINKFKPLNFRQEIIYEKKNLKIINDSKSTSLSSSIPLLKSNQKIYWILGGIFKKGDVFKLEKKYFNSLKVFIYGKDKNLFYKLLNKKVEIEIGNTLRDILLSISRNIKKTKYKLTIIFSPAAASFDQFKNFEHRGKVFNKLVKKYLIN